MNVLCAGKATRVKNHRSPVANSSTYKWRQHKTNEENSWQQEDTSVTVIVAFGKKPRRKINELFLLEIIFSLRMRKRFKVTQEGVQVRQVGKADRT